MPTIKDDGSVVIHLLRQHSVPQQVTVVRRNGDGTNHVQLYTPEGPTVTQYDPELRKPAEGQA